MKNIVLDLLKKKLIIMNIFDIIKYWDDNLVEQHLGWEMVVILQYLNDKTKTHISYLDIGANCGKYYDVLSKDFIIDYSVMAEASVHLYEYLLVKFKDNKKCFIYNSIVSDVSGKTSFSEIDFSYITNINNSINLGLSKTYNSHNNNREQISAKDFFNAYIINNNINQLDFIKIDTENRDYHIIKSLTHDCIEKLKNKPLIVFENNYHNDMSKNDAQVILDNFCSFNNYKFIDIDNIQQTGAFLWPLI